ncbi:response regulator transcription factor [Castellaniella sp. S9]|uniref:response regulator transcription factor n=1 Tax=Castellaniella sp. S9 TaxID=2993652 RepID=UPI0022B3771F|nr:response regulator transcription factor [Castellaniella sp. S9]
METNTPLLLVEDDETFRTILAGYLEAKGWTVEMVSTGHEMLHRISSGHYGLILLDLGLPDEDGLALLRKLLGRSDVPVMVITGRTDIDARLTAFELGAADVLTKPLNPRELQYRVLNLLRHSSPSTPVSYLEAAPWRVDVASRTVVSSLTNQPCALTRAEFDTLAFLLRAQGRVCSRAQILDAITVSSDPESERAVDTLVSRLRKKLGVECDAGALILTVRGIGYRIDPQAAAPVSPAATPG